MFIKHAGDQRRKGEQNPDEAWQGEIWQLGGWGWGVNCQVVLVHDLVAVRKTGICSNKLIDYLEKNVHVHPGFIMFGDHHPDGFLVDVYG